MLFATNSTNVKQVSRSIAASSWWRSLRDENAQDAAIKAETQKLLYTPGVVELVAANDHKVELLSGLSKNVWRLTDSLDD
jgi:hypothetical protein